MKRNPLSLATWLLVSGFVIAHNPVMAETKDKPVSYPEAVVTADRTQSRLPVVPDNYSHALPDAYQVQRELIADRQSRGEKIIGYKAGLTSKKAQEKFSASAPLLGVLTSEAQLKKMPVQLPEGHKWMLEQELAFRLKRDFTQPLDENTPLTELIDAVAPAFEIANLAFTGKPRVYDITANNVANEKFWLGKWQQIPSEIDSLPVSLTCNDSEVNRANSGATMNGQRTALIWMINKALNEGYPLRQGDILLTGSLGRMVPAMVGACEGDFGSLGKLSLKLVRSTSD